MAIPHQFPTDSDLLALLSLDGIKCGNAYLGYTRIETHGLGSNFTPPSYIQMIQLEFKIVNGVFGENTLYYISLRMNLMRDASGDQDNVAVIMIKPGNGDRPTFICGECDHWFSPSDVIARKESVANFMNNVRYKLNNHLDRVLLCEALEIAIGTVCENIEEIELQD